MILAPLIKQLIGTLWYLLPILILAALFKSSWFKGVMGEFIVNVVAKLMLDKNVYWLGIFDNTVSVPHFSADAAVLRLGWCGRGFDAKVLRRV